MPTKISERFLLVFDPKSVPIRRVRETHYHNENGHSYIVSGSVGNSNGIVRLYQPYFYPDIFGMGLSGEIVLIHELAHAWDFKTKYTLSEAFEEYIGASTEHDKYAPGDQVPPSYPLELLNRREDFAASFAEYARPIIGTQILPGTKRWTFIDILLTTGRPPFPPPGGGSPTPDSGLYPDFPRGRCL